MKREKGEETWQKNLKENSNQQKGIRALDFIMSTKPTLLNDNDKSKTPRSPTSPTIRQFLQAERSSSLSNNLKVSLKKGKTIRQEEDGFSFEPSKKQSVLAKFKEKARKWRRNLGRKKQGQGSDPTPSWGVAYEDYEKDENHHHLGTPMHALRRSLGSYKEYMRQRSRSGLAITEKHVLACSLRRGYSEDCERLIPKENPSPTMRFPGYREEIEKLMPIKATEHKTDEYDDHSSEIKIREIEEAEKEKTSSYQKGIQEVKEEHMTSQETVQEAEELNLNCLKLIEQEKGRTPTPSPEEGAFEEEKQEIDCLTQKKTLAEAVTEKLITEGKGLALSEPLRVATTRKEAPVVVNEDEEDYEEYGIAGENKWDKGVSVKEYINNKLEPGEDERALSQVISEAISPRRTPGDKGIMEKVKEAVTLLLLAEQRQMEREQEERQKQQQQQQQQQEEQQEQKQRINSSTMRHPNSSVQMPVSINPYEDDLNVEEDNRGRILQAN